MKTMRRIRSHKRKYQFLIDNRQGWNPSIPETRGTMIHVSSLPLLPTGRTPTMMHIDRAPAGLTGPAFPFGLNKIPDAMYPDRLEVLDHAHVIPRLISLVQLPEPPAGILSTGMTVSPAYLLAGEDRAVPFTLPVR
jgi:hypothetical protein